MKENKLFYLAIVANIAQLGLCFLYWGGLPLLIGAFLPMHFILFFLNCNAAKKLWHDCVLAVLHIAATILTNYIYGRLYLERVCWDFMGEMLSLGATLLAAVIVSVMWGIIILQEFIYMYKQKKNNAETE